MRTPCQKPFCWEKKIKWVGKFVNGYFDIEEWGEAQPITIAALTLTTLADILYFLYPSTTSSIIRVHILKKNVFPSKVIFPVNIIYAIFRFIKYMYSIVCVYAYYIIFKIFTQKLRAYNIITRQKIIIWKSLKKNLHCTSIDIGVEITISMCVGTTINLVGVITIVKWKFPVNTHLVASSNTKKIVNIYIYITLDSCMSSFGSSII